MKEVMKMTTVEKLEERVLFLLKDSAEMLRTEDLTRIIEATRRAGAVVHVSSVSFQVLIGVPEKNGRRVEETLESMGYPCLSHSGKISDHSTFELKGASHEAVL
jgi:hypothetical protein